MTLSFTGKYIFGYFCINIIYRLVLFNIVKIIKILIANNYIFPQLVLVKKSMINTILFKIFYYFSTDCVVYS